MEIPSHTKCETDWKLAGDCKPTLDPIVPAVSISLFVRAFMNFPAIGGQHFIRGRNALIVQLTPPPETAGSRAISAKLRSRPARDINISVSISESTVSMQVLIHFTCSLTLQLECHTPFCPGTSEDG
jgi:hypothetical protein